MAPFVHPGWLRKDRFAPIAAVYVVVALVLGLAGGDLFGLFAGAVSPISSSSAVAILSAIASGTMALTAIIFSFAFLALQMGTASYSPRLVGVMARRGSMGHMLGVLSGTFVYALLAIRTIDIAGKPGVNLLVVVLAMFWLVGSVITVVLLLPRIRGLAIGELLASLYRSAEGAVIRIYRPQRSEPPAAPASPPGRAVDVIRHAGSPLYLVGIDTRALVRLAIEADAVIVIDPAIGDAVIAGDRLAGVVGERGRIAKSKLRAALWLAPERIVDNDPAYVIRLMVDIAIRALSPAVNDPTTAVSVLDEIDGLLRLLGRRQLEDNQLVDDRGQLRVVRTVATWDDLVVLALTEIHHYGRDSFQVQRRLASLIRDQLATLPEHRRPAIERFGRWRAATLDPSLRDAGAWTDPSGCDRQGLGHLPPGGHRLSR